jgi:hypothetical protein
VRICDRCGDVDADDVDHHETAWYMVPASTVRVQVNIPAKEAPEGASRYLISSVVGNGYTRFMSV